MADTAEDHWPHVTELIRMLDDLDGREITVHATPAPTDLVEHGRQVSLALDAYEKRVGRKR